MKKRGLSGPVDLNRTGIEELMKLPRIGEKTARAIIDYRKANGQVRSVNDLRTVPEMSRETFEPIQDLVTMK